MYRKVHNSMLAFSATGVLLLVGLMAGTPAIQAQTAQVVRTLAVGPLLLRLESPATPAAHAEAVNIEARAKALEAQIERSASAAEAVSHTAAFAANIVARTALAQATADDASPIVLDDEQAGAADERQSQRRHVRRARAALALPYFSFAQGLRRNRS